MLVLRPKLVVADEPTTALDALDEPTGVVTVP